MKKRSKAEKEELIKKSLRKRIQEGTALGGLSSLQPAGRPGSSWT
jgi:hypothetical protein